MINARSKALLIRADASTKIGTGHAMRCLALAQAWQVKGGTVHFAMVDSPAAITARLKVDGVQVIELRTKPGGSDDADRTVQLARKIGADWIVVDGYHFDADYQRAVKEAGLNLLFVDDYGHAGHYYADAVLNQNIYADESLYTAREPYTKLLLGTHYTLLRREFWRWLAWERVFVPAARRVLVTLGGSDPDNVTLKVIRALEVVEVGSLDVAIVAGGSNPYFADLQQQVATWPQPASLQQNVHDMPALMAWADVVISASGSTSWELAFMQTPALLLSVAENQRPVSRELAKRGVALDLGWHETITAEDIRTGLLKLIKSRTLRQAMGLRGREIVDGRGSNRVIGEMNVNSRIDVAAGI